jgi:Ca2+:H+ antiporter
MNIKNWIFAILLVFVPISIAWNFLRWDVTIVFLSACLAIVPLAAYMGKATEEIAVVVGPNLGGLLNATFGNATELILAYAALEEGLIEVVKATITGSIIGNLLLVTGLSMFFGGLRYKEQKFQPVTARLNSSSMNLAVAAILLPTTVQYTGQPMALDFDPFELVAVAVAVWLTNSISNDGRSNWLEGILLVATYAVIALAFFFHPAAA